MSKIIIPDEIWSKKKHHKKFAEWFSARGLKEELYSEGKIDELKKIFGDEVLNSDGTLSDHLTEDELKNCERWEKLEKEKAQ